MRPRMNFGLIVFFILFLILLFAEGTVSAEPINDPENHPPVAVASIQEDPEDLWTNMTIKLSSAGSYDIDGEGRITIIWDFGDDSDPSYLPNPIHIYEQPGIYTVTLTVIDSKGVSDTATQILVVLLDYGGSDVVIKAIDPTSQQRFFDPTPDQIAQVAVKRDGWIAYLCDLKKADKIGVHIVIIGDRPVDVYLFKHEDFLTYKNGPHMDRVPSEVKGYSMGLTDEFSYLFTAQEADRYYIVIDNRNSPPGTDTEGPVDYGISIDPRWEETGGEPDYPWDKMCFGLGPVVGMLVLLVAIVAVVILQRRWELQ